MNRKPLVLLALAGMLSLTACKDDKKPSDPVSYTHLTLPTIYSV